MQRISHFCGLLRRIQSSKLRLQAKPLPGTQLLELWAAKARGIEKAISTDGRVVINGCYLQKVGTLVENNKARLED